MIVMDKKKKVFLLQLREWSYAFAVNREGNLNNLHWGGPVNGTEDLPETGNLLRYRHRKPERSLLVRQEYPGSGFDFYDEPALRVLFGNGVRACLLKYAGAETTEIPGGEELAVTLREAYYPLEVRLHYRVWHDCGVMERFAEIRNLGDRSLTLESVMSASWSLPRIDGNYRLTHLAGRWGREGMIQQQPVMQNRIVLESRTGLSGPFAMPFFALDEGDAGEEHGDVWFGSVEHNGNWKICVNRDAYEEVSVTGGVNDFDFSWPLKPGETFTTPVFCGGLSRSGFGGAARLLHDYQRGHLLPESARDPVPLLVNTWASLHTDVDESSVMAVLEKAARIGAELFVIDDGWQEALGDWRPDPVKFPRGLAPLLERAKQLGMEFGLWVEIESAEERSRLYAEHPEWVMCYKDRPVPCQRRADIDRTSFLLNFGRDDVREYFHRSLHELIAGTGIHYLKLDMNCCFTAPGWEAAAPEERRTIWHRYAMNLQRLFADLGREFPEVRFENCASGGARSDLAMSRSFGRINRSDNQDPLDILRLHEGFSRMHLPGLAGGACHISDDMFYVNHRRMPLEFQALAGMLGSLAVGKKLSACSDMELEAIREWGELYKQIRDITWHGEFYRLIPLEERPYAAFEYVSKDRSRALLFLFVRETQFSMRLPAIRLRGLAREGVYTLRRYGAEPVPEYGEDLRPRSGNSLMEIGLQADMLEGWRARLYLMEQEKQK
ncbi:MAG: alpha-galactosidase [Lentisphaeria bacterium]|nr:alpha-galactosidase [Lentisphaeria bacterium]